MIQNERSEKKKQAEAEAAWNAVAARLGIPSLKEKKSLSPLFSTKGVRSQYAAIVSDIVHGKDHRKIFLMMSDVRREALLANIRFAIGCYPEWSNDMVRSRNLILDMSKRIIMYGCLAIYSIVVNVKSNSFGILRQNVN